MAEPQRIAVLEDDTALADSGTKVMDVDLTDPISSLEVFVRCANGSTSNQANHIHDCVSKVELVDGSDVLWSLSMLKGQALNYWETYELPIMRITEWPGDGAHDATFIRFGRHEFDTEYAFLAKRFLNPQLKITWDLETIRDVAVTAFATGEAKLTVIAKTLPEAAGAKGFLMSKDLHSWTTVGSGDEAVDLPRDFPYRLMVVRSFEAGNDFRENINNLKLTCDHDRDVIFNIKPDRLSEWLHARYGMAQEGGRIFRTHMDTVYCHVFEPYQLAIGARNDDTYWHMVHYWSGNFDLRSYKLLSNATWADDKMGWYTVNGGYPHCTVAWPFGDIQKEADAFNPRQYGSVKLKASQAQSGAAASVILQQYRPY